MCIMAVTRRFIYLILLVRFHFDRSAILVIFTLDLVVCYFIVLFPESLEGVILSYLTDLELRFLN